MSKLFSGLFIPFHHLPPVAVEAGLSKSQAAFLISAIGKSIIC
jgi:hypothetical protein